MEIDQVMLFARVTLSLACVLGLIWYIGKRVNGPGGVARRRGATLRVVGRQSVGGKSSVVLVEIEGRRLVLGVSEHGVQLLTELAGGAAGTEELAATDKPAGESLPARVVARAAAAAATASGRTAMSAMSTPGVLRPEDELTERVELDLATLDLVAFSEADEAPDDARALTDGPMAPAAPSADHDLAHLSTPAARMPAVPSPRNPLEGSILAAATWRRAVVAVQERTLRR